MGWLGRLFDARDTLARMVLLDLSGIGYLAFGITSGRHLTTPQLVLAVLAFLGAVLLHKWPVAGFLVQATLLAVSFLVLHDPTIGQVGTGWLLLEVVIWAGRTRTIVLCALFTVAVYAVDASDNTLQRLPHTIFGSISIILLPIMVGMLVRTTRELGRQSQERIAAEQSRRESESRAARAEERATIARELHDVVAHHVASMVLRVGVAQHVLTDLDPRVAEVFDDVHDTGSEALADLRRLVALLRAPDSVRGDAAQTAIDPASLPAALSAAVANAERAGVEVDADIDSSVTTVDSAHGLALLRLTQEALTNVAKHAGPSPHATLKITVHDGTLLWEVTDNGGATTRPLPPIPGGHGTTTRPAPPIPGGHGVTGMRERVEVLGGTLTAGPYGPGWRVATSLPAASPSSSPPPSSVPRPGATSDPLSLPAVAPGSSPGVASVEDS